MEPDPQAAQDAERPPRLARNVYLSKHIIQFYTHSQINKPPVRDNRNAINL